MPMSLKVTGYKETAAEFRLMREVVQGQANRAAVRAGAHTILEAIVERTPVLDRRSPLSSALEPGALKDDMGIKMDPVDKLGFLRAWIGPRKLGHVAYWVEVGHRLVKSGYSSMKRGKLQGTGHQIGDVPAKPFVRPGYEASASQSLLSYATELQKQLQKWMH